MNDQTSTPRPDTLFDGSVQQCPYGFYDKLLAFLDHCVEHGVLKQRNRAIPIVVRHIDEVFTALGI